jgi:hypothetical protein
MRTVIRLVKRAAAAERRAREARYAFVERSRVARVTAVVVVTACMNVQFESWYPGHATLLWAFSGPYAVFMAVCEWRRRPVCRRR